MVLNLKLTANGRRYVHVAAESRWRVFLQSWCGAGLSGYFNILALAKTVTPGGSPRREPGQAVPQATRRSSLVRKFSRYGKAIAYTALLAAGLFIHLSYIS